jgi:hypothetical protein
MTLDEFFRKLPRIGWKLTPDGAIRCKDGRCPLERTVDIGKGRWLEAALRLGLMDDADDIVASADNNVYSVKPLRARLLRHCGLAKRGRK